MVKQKKVNEEREREKKSAEKTLRRVGRCNFAHRTERVCVVVTQAAMVFFSETKEYDEERNSVEASTCVTIVTPSLHK